MGGSSKAPEPTAEEISLQREQLNSLQQQRLETEAFKPLLYKQMGLRETINPLTAEQISRKTFLENELSRRPVTDPQSGFVTNALSPGQIKRYQVELSGIRPTSTLQEVPWEERLAAMSPQDRAGYELNDLYLKRQRDAMEGKLPVSPAMEAELAQQQADLAANLSRRLGSGWEKSTPGIQSMSEFNKRAGLLREEARSGQITSGEGLLGARMGLMQNQQSQFYNQAKGWPTSGLNNAYSQAMQPFQDYRNMQSQASAQNAANRSGMIAAGAGTVATIAVVI